MKVKTLSALAGLGGALIMSSTADAAFLGVQLVDVTNWWSTVGPVNPRAHFNSVGAGSNYTVYRLFAMFDNTGVANAANRVNAIFGTTENGGHNWGLTMHSGSIYNHISDPGGKYEQHFNLAPTTGAAGFDNDRRGWETWATIGTQNTASVAAWSPGAEAAVNNFTGSFSTDAAALFITPDDTQGRAIALSTATAAGMGHTGFGVLLMQIAVNNNGALPAQFSGIINVEAGGQQFYDLTFSNVIPAPGAMALLGLAGLVGSRRRRG